MTREDEFIGQLEPYLDDYEGITPLPDTRSRRHPRRAPEDEAGRPSDGPARFTGMSNAYKVGIAAAVIGVAALIGISVYNNPDYGEPTAGTPIPTGVPATLMPLPGELQHRFRGRTGECSQAIVFPVRRQGRSCSSSRRSSCTTMGPGPVPLPPSSLVLRDRADVDHQCPSCEVGEVGTYPYHLSPGGTIRPSRPGRTQCAKPERRFRRRLAAIQLP